MTNTQTQEVITNALTQWGSSVLAILGVVIGIGVAYLIFSFGWQKIKFSMSVRDGLSDPDDAPNFWKGERMGKRGSGNWSF